MEIEHRAQMGDVQAQLALARHHESQGRYDLARGWLARAARGGEIDAIRSLGINLLTCAPVMAQDGVGLMRQAAERGDAEALHICAVIAGQDNGLPSRWRIALDYLARSARQGSRLAQEELMLLAGRDCLPPLWEEIAQNVDIGHWLTVAASEACFEAPSIRVSRGFAKPAECDWLTARAQPRLKAAELYDPASGGGFRGENIRNNTDTSFNIAQSDLIVVLLRERIAMLTGLSVENMEPVMVLHYDPGQYFAPHCDGLDPALPKLASEIARRGQRVVTLLLYLNDDYQGGETDFPELNWKFKGRKGDALWFWNVGTDGLLDFRTRHAGLAPEDGEKWLLTQWIRRPG